jgi:hypothetical protein
MRLGDFMGTINGSVRDDWTLVVEGHAVMGNDIRISFKFGERESDVFQEPWATSFPDSHAYAINVGFYFCDALVFTEDCVLVDGGRVILPMPDIADSLDVSADRAARARIAQGIRGIAYDFDQYVSRAGLSVVP